MSPRSARPKSKAPKPSKKAQGIGQEIDQEIEWIGGTVLIPSLINDESEDAPYRPEALLWLNADGAILGSILAKPGELMPLVSDCLQRTIERPMLGRPHSPTRIRVASDELAKTLRGAHGGLDIVCAPTPEIDEVAAAMERDIGAPSEMSYLALGVEPAAMASFFKAAAALFRAQPWKQVPNDQTLLSVTMEQFGLRNAVVSVIGQMDQHYGFVLFTSIDDFKAYLDAADQIDERGEAGVPPHMAIEFERGAELEPELRKEISEHHWEVAGAHAYPWVAAVDQGLTARAPTSKELTKAEAITIALTHLMVEKKALRQAWEGGEPVSRTLSVTTHQGEVEVTISAPFVQAPVEINGSVDVIAKLAALAQNSEYIDPEARRPLEEELIRRFAASPEAQGLGQIYNSQLVMDLAANYFGQTIATLSALDMRALIFDVIPRKVVIEPSDASSIVHETRALYKFLKREFGLKQADPCMRLLGGNAVKRLEAALSDGSHFGIGKALFSTGVQNGFELPQGEPSTTKPGHAGAKKSKGKAASKGRKKK